MSKESHDRMVRAVELALAALIGGMFSSMVYVLWSSNDPFNLTAMGYILLFAVFIMVLMFCFYTFVDWFYKLIYKK